MDWKSFNVWYDFLLKIEYKDIIIDKTIRDFRRIDSDQKNNKYKISNQVENKNIISNEDWKMYGKINNLLDKILKMFSNISELKTKLNAFDLGLLMLPRLCSKTTQKCQKSSDIKEGKMYNIPAEYNGIDTNDKDTYLYIPIHKTRRHIHGVPNEFLIQYIYNMIETASWEKHNYFYYTDIKYIKNCAIYQCPEKYTIKNQDKTKEITCDVQICVLTKIIELEKYLSNDEVEKVKNYFHKKIVDNFRKNFPNKSRYITYCPGSCYDSNGLIHIGIPSVKQSCNDCAITYCRECRKIPFHFNQLCDPIDLQTITNIVFENPDNYRKCPGCEIWIEKEEGCDHMKCLCGVHFCYTCRNVLCANDPYYHVCSMDNADPHYRDFAIDDNLVRYQGEIACKCIHCE
jgi:hypothetical protein